MQDIIGHSHILDFFKKAIAKGAVSHAYCFTGPSHVGKRTVAECIAGDILRVSREKLHTSPDFTILEQEVNEKTDKLRKDISIEQVRPLIQRMSQRAFGPQGYKVAIIDTAELMSTGASNALLKTLEEPSEQTIIFLITHDEQKLLPTIRSRCQVIHFNLVSDTVVEHFINTKITDTGHARQITQFAHGRPGMAMTWISDPDAFESYVQEVNRFKDLIGKPFYEKLASVEQLFSDKLDHIEGRNALQHALSIWQIALHDMLREKKLSSQSIVGVNDAIIYARTFLRQNVHPRLLVEHVLLQLP